MEEKRQREGGRDDEGKKREGRISKREDKRGALFFEMTFRLLSLCLLFILIDRMILIESSHTCTR